MRFHRDVNQSGGMLVTKACHEFDQMNFFLGVKPRRVFSAQYKRLFGRGGDDAREGCSSCDRATECDFDRLHRQPGRTAKRKYAHIYLDDDKVTTDGYMLDKCVWREDTELRDLAQVMFEYENGVPATFTQVLFSPNAGRYVQIFGADGSLLLDPEAHHIIVRDRWNTRSETINTSSPGGGHGGADPAIIGAFMRSVRTGEAPPCTIEDGVWALAMAYGAYQSSDTEKWVDLEPLVASVMTGAPLAESR
jgi:predicted dehydrogenase